VKLLRQNGFGGPARAQKAGFSLIELMIVVAVIMCICAVTIPSMLHSVAALRCRLTMSSLSGLIQQSRSYAIKRNKPVAVHFATVSGRSVAYIQDAAATASLANAIDSKKFYLGNGISQMDTPSGTNAPPQLTGEVLWGSGTPSTGDIAFNSRGLPCFINTANTPPTCDMNDASGNAPGYVLYFTYQPPFGQNGWSAISVSSAGRVKTWMASGAAWLSN
jgi:Tfp pilus assembly protein FimT